MKAENRSMKFTPLHARSSGFVARRLPSVVAAQDIKTMYFPRTPVFLSFVHRGDNSRVPQVPMLAEQCLSRSIGPQAVQCPPCIRLYRVCFMAKTMPASVSASAYHVLSTWSPTAWTLSFYPKQRLATRRKTHFLRHLAASSTFSPRNQRRPHIPSKVWQGRCACSSRTTSYPQPLSMSDRDLDLQYLQWQSLAMVCPPSS